MNRKRVVIGLSGGVDSSVAAALLLEQGYEVESVYLECYNEPGCRTDQDKADALKVAIKLGIKFEVLDFRREYRERVIEYFYSEYEAGRTPNPDVACNREIKFGIFYKHAIEQGYDYVATGHYARICAVPQLHGDTVTLHLQRARDESKDQSYFLWQVPRDHLDNMLFPLGGMLKSAVREKAKLLGLPTASKPDSMGICFIGEVNVGNLLKERLGEKEGEVVVLSGGDTVTQSHIGTHRGLWFYTIGERIGSDVRLQTKDMKRAGLVTNNMPPLYVVGKDKENNRLIVGRREETMTTGFKIQDLGFKTNDSDKLWVRIRNLGELVAVTRLHTDLPGGKTCTVTLSKPIFAVAEGQSSVFYDEQGILVAGGIIC